MFEKLAFWRQKEEPLAMPKDYEVSQEPFSAPSLPLPSEQPQQFGMPQALRPAEPGFGVQPIQPVGGVPIEKDLQLIAAKLDAIKAGIDTVNAKIDKLERKGIGEEPVRWR